MTARGAWDPNLKGILLLTTTTAETPYETWLYQGLTWRRVATGGPPYRSRPKLATDLGRGKVLLVGDSIGNNFDVWEWDGNVWTDRTPATPLPRRGRFAIAYDEQRHRVVIFGGETQLGVSNETWEYDGTSWSQQTPLHSPPPRNDPAMAYDSARKVMVMFGGNSNTVFLDTWEWDGQDWTMRSATIPDAINPNGQPQMGFDKHRGKTVLLMPSITGEGTITWEFPQSNPPWMESGPEGRMACLNGPPVTFAVTAAGDPPLSYRWRRNESILNIPTADSPTLTITNTDFGSMGNYDCVVTNACGSVTSNSATLTICAGADGCPQPLDVNGDGTVDGADIQRFVEVLLGY